MANFVFLFPSVSLHLCIVAIGSHLKTLRDLNLNNLMIITHHKTRLNCFTSKRTLLIIFLLLLSGLGGLLPLSAQVWQQYTTTNSPISSDFTGDIKANTNGEVWFGPRFGGDVPYSNTSISVKDGSNWSQVSYHVNGFPGGISDMVALPNGNKWATSGKDLVEWTGTGFNYFTPPINTLQTTSVDTDAVGNIWFTGYGLNKWDGTTLTQYTSSNSGLPNNLTRDVTTDASGNIWVVTGLGLTKLNGTTWNTYNTTNSTIPWNSVTKVITDGVGGLWLAGNSFTGMAHFDGNTTFTLYNTSNSSLPNNTVRNLAIDASGDVWVATSGGVAEFTGTVWNVYTTSNSTISSNNCQAIGVDGNTVWAYTSDRILNQFNGTAWTSNNPGLIFSNNASNLSIDYNGDVWISGSLGLLQYDGANFNLHNKSNTNYHTDQVNDISFTNFSGNALIGNEYGMAEFDGSNWTIYNTLNTPFNWDRVTFCAEGSSAGTYWVLVNDATAYRYNGTAWTELTTANSGLPSNSVYCMESDLNGNVWFGTAFGLTHYNGTTWTTYNTSNSPLANNFVIELSQGIGQIVIVSGGGGNNLQGLTPFNTWTSYTLPPGTNIGAVHYSPGSGLWIASSPGVWRYDSPGWTLFDQSNTGMSLDSTLVIEDDSSGTMWFGGYHGAIRFGPGPSVNLGNDTTLCPGDSILLDAGSGFSNYLWNTGDTTQTIWTSGAGSYWVTITDNGSTASDTLTLSFFTTGPFTINLGPDTTLCSSGSLTLDVGAIPGAVYLWNTNDTTQSTTVTSSGIYSVFALDQCGNVGFDSIEVTFSPAISIELRDSGLVNTPILPQDTTFCEDTLHAFVPPPANCSTCTFLWNNGSTAPNQIITSSGTYSVILDDGNGCLAYDTIEVTIDTACVWPGDANDDLIANNVDVLALGLAFGNNGSPRVAPHNNNNWYGHPGADWSTFFANGVNHKHADCDGNRVVQQADLSVISQNYGLTHNKGLTGLAGPNDPDLYFDMLQDSANAGDTVTFLVSLGRDTLPADSVYGIAFTFHYDPMLIDSSSVVIHYDSSWLGTLGTDLISLDKDFYGSGSVEIGISRTDQQTRNGWGRIASISVVVQDDVAGKDFIYENLQLGLSTVTLISADESLIPVNVDTGNVVIYQFVDGIEEENHLAGVKVYPNPTRNQLIIESPDARLQNLELTDLRGQKLLTQTINNASQTKMELDHLAPGVYFLQLSDGKFRETRKIVIAR